MILAGKPRAMASAEIIAQLQPDVLVLSGIDHDADRLAQKAFRELVAARGLSLPHSMAPRPNSGRATGLDMNGDGITHGPDDTQGYGNFTGERGLAVLSALPLLTEGMRDFTGFLWKDLPGALLFDGATEAQRAIQRLSSTVHFELPVQIAEGRVLRLLAYGAGPPAFGGHPDRNINRNHDETAFWLHLLNGTLPMAPPPDPFVIIGQSNQDPHDGDGLPGAMRSLLAHPALQDPRPESRGATLVANPEHAGPAALDTALWLEAQGNLRVSYILPSADIGVRASGVLWPEPGSPLATTLERAGTAHRPVWADIVVN